MVRKRKFLILVTLGLGLLISSLGFGMGADFANSR